MQAIFSFKLYSIDQSQLFSMLNTFVIISELIYKTLIIKSIIFILDVIALKFVRNIKNISKFVASNCFYKMNSS